MPRIRNLRKFSLFHRHAGRRHQNHAVASYPKMSGAKFLKSVFHEILYCIYSLRAGYRASNMTRLMEFLTWNRFDYCRQSGTPIVRRRTGSLMRGRAFEVAKFS